MSVSLTLPESLEQAARQMADQSGVTLDEFVASALAEKIGALSTEEFFRKKREGATLDDFRKYLDNVPDVPPEPGDELPDGWSQ
ncbi:hypothetical protein C882_1399 [Caenispirillum salinarum AK4]|uniref:Toxin-antitoxin system HicB family antitoxin n=1 Tax=Caenispirillum salinarum AK4 TaxID=1238182 RepID=K9HAE0_9PROT|nr:hypothetical protein [Caenispirillum salinarum]EKV27553.1 hypothetical protein C882_1399 [Caenispirillum salinarum AK4]